MSMSGILGSSGTGEFILGADDGDGVFDTPRHRLTEEFLEVPYRDALVGSPARITQEFLAAVYRVPFSSLVDGVRLTQQTVEILYLEPEPVPGFDDCGAFSGVRKWEARLYDNKNPTTGKRNAYGSDGYDLDGVIQTLNLEIQERGGYAGGSFEFL